MATEIVGEVKIAVEELCECHSKMTRYLHETHKTRYTTSGQLYFVALGRLRTMKQLYDRIRCRLDICAIRAEDVNNTHERLSLQWKLKALRDGLIKEMSAMVEDDDELDTEEIICIHEVTNRDASRYNKFINIVKQLLEGRSDTIKINDTDIDDTDGYDYAEEPARLYMKDGGENTLQEAYRGIGTRGIQGTTERSIQWTSFIIDDEMIWAKKLPSQVVFGFCHVNDWANRENWNL